MEGEAPSPLGPAHGTSPLRRRDYPPSPPTQAPPIAGRLLAAERSGQDGPGGLPPHVGDTRYLRLHPRRSEGAYFQGKELEGVDVEAFHAPVDGLLFSERQRRRPGDLPGRDREPAPERGQVRGGRGLSLLRPHCRRRTLPQRPVLGLRHVVGSPGGKAASRRRPPLRARQVRERGIPFPVLDASWDGTVGGGVFLHEVPAGNQHAAICGYRRRRRPGRYTHVAGACHGGDVHRLQGVALPHHPARGREGQLAGGYRQRVAPPIRRLLLGPGPDLHRSGHGGPGVPRGRPRGRDARRGNDRYDWSGDHG
mmetsp:Transcript_43198/g.91879  ORF Transcript_43198/g.91879 Transcript_43198/m.91879 type:complete len:309 (+) Transcript_43198:521-1447(+)